MNKNIQAVFVMVIINTVLAFFLASQPIGASSPLGLFTRISDTYKAVLRRTNQPSLKWFLAKKITEISLEPLLLQEVCTSEDTLSTFHLLL